jgi:predicted choloylglycine hydrolase
MFGLWSTQMVDHSMKTSIAVFVTILAGTFSAPASGECTSFAFNTEDRPIFAANYDFPDELEDGLIFVNPRNTTKRGWTVNIANDYKPDATSEQITWVSRYGSVAFNLVGYGLVWGGTNERGLCVSTMNLPETKVPHPDGRPRINGTAWLQFILDTCATTDEVVAAVDRFSIETVDHYHFCDGSGNSLIVEFIDGECVLKRGTTSQTRALTNSTFLQSTRAAEDPTTISPGDPFDSLKRYCTVTERLKQFRIQQDDPIEFAFDTLKAAKNPSSTEWSIVFDLRNGRLYYRTRSHPHRKSIDIARLEFAVPNRVEMLPIQSSASGDLTSAFYPYRNDESVRHTLAFITGYIAYKDLPDLPNPKAWVKRLVEHLEAGIEASTDDAIVEP